MGAADLRIFEAVARLGSMSRAASELHTVQSNVTARIRKLEREIGVALLARSRRGVTLTPAGHRLLPFARQLPLLIEEAKRTARDDGQPQGTLQFGSLETTAAVRLPRVLAAYAKAHPTVDLVLRTGTTDELIAAVLQRHLEGALVCGPVRQMDLVEETVFREELVIVAPRGRRSLPAVFADPALKIVILRLGCSYRQRLEEILARRGAVPARRLEFGTIDGIMGCVAAGIGVSLLPKTLVTSHRLKPALAVHRLPAAESLVDTVFIRRANQTPTSAAKAFLALAKRRGVAV
jgi:DNA-binding transcriptional LysR family regulator